MLVVNVRGLPSPPDLVGGAGSHGMICCVRSSVRWVGKFGRHVCFFFAMNIPFPIGSMYAIYGNIYHQYTPNVSIYAIHGSYGFLFDPPYHPTSGESMWIPNFCWIDIIPTIGFQDISSLVVEVGVNQVSHGSYDQTISFFWMFMCCISPIQIETWCGKPRNKPNNATHTTHTNSPSGWYYKTDPKKKTNSFWYLKNWILKTILLHWIWPTCWFAPDILWERIQNTELYHWAKVIYRRHLYYIPIRNDS